MESSGEMHEIIAILDYVERTRCLCLFKNDSKLFDIYFNTLWSNLLKEGADAECGLLCVSILRETAEIYVRKNVKSANVCETVTDFVKIFWQDETWSRIAKHFQRTPDKYLRYALSEALAAVMNGFPPPLFKVRLEHIVGQLPEAAMEDSSTYIFELLIALGNCKTKMTNSDDDSCECKNTISCLSPSLEDNLSCLCAVLSEKWNTLKNLFVRPENANIDAFLCLWKLMCELSPTGDLSSIFLNLDFALEFPSLSPKLSSIPLRLYVEVITQILCSSLKPDSWKHVAKNAVEDSVIPTISSGVLNSIAVSYQGSTFFTVPETSCACIKEDGKVDIVSKKVIFIYLNLISEIRNSVPLCEALRKVFITLASPAVKWKSGHVHVWVVDTFIEEDDLLFGVMLSLLRIYCTLRDVECLRFETSNDHLQSYKNELDPHRIFIKFLQQIGNDNNELLSFLLSDETCYLLYLMQYLKLLLLEWQQFIEAHNILLPEKNVREGESIQKLSIPGEGVSAKKLVSYSSSSSSEDEPEDTAENSVFAEDVKCLSECALKTLLVLICLKEAIQKLVDLEEFPYNASPLLNLLGMCSKKASDLT